MVAARRRRSGWTPPSWHSLDKVTPGRWPAQPCVSSWHGPRRGALLVQQRPVSCAMVASPAPAHPHSSSTCQKDQRAPPRHGVLPRGPLASRLWSDRHPQGGRVPLVRRRRPSGAPPPPLRTRPWAYPGPPQLLMRWRRWRAWPGVVLTQRRQRCRPDFGTVTPRCGTQRNTIAGQFPTPLPSPGELDSRC